jgi:ubiquinone/menaquinone biosynthesis C-methylase UbiE
MYRVHLAYCENKIVHHTFVTRGYFKFPFVGINDAQIGQIRTHAAHRNKGLASYILHKIICSSDDSVHRFFYVCEGSNVASRRLAESVGFACETSAKRTGISGLRRYALIAENIQDYSTVTERPGSDATREQVERLVQRYRFAADFTYGKDILEIACGTGIGLAYIAKEAKSAVGVDIDVKNIGFAADTYGSSEGGSKQQDFGSLAKLSLGPTHRLDFRTMDAHALQFPNNCFDIVLLFEAIYYLRDPALFVSEAHRVMRDDGMLIIGSVNKEWASYHPSPFAYRYFAASELYSMLHGIFRDVSVYAGFEENKDKFVMNVLKRWAIRLSLIPSTLEGRAKLKRIFLGRMSPLPQELSGVLDLYAPPSVIPHDIPCQAYKIIYAIAKK